MRAGLNEAVGGGRNGVVLRKLDRAQTNAALALPGARCGVRRLTEGQLATLYLTLDFEERWAIPDRLSAPHRG